MKNKEILQNLPPIPQKVIANLDNNNTYYNAINNNLKNIEKNVNNNITKNNVTKNVVAKKKKEVKLYKNVDNIKLSIFKKKNNDHPILSSITIDEFREKINDKRFIEKYKKSINDLFKYKETILGNFLSTPDIDVKSKRKIEALLQIIKAQYQIINSKEGNDIIKNNLLDCLDNKLYGILSMKGRNDVLLKFLSLIYAFSNNYNIFIRNANFSISGNIGVGKKSVLNIIANVLNKAFIILTNNIYFVNKEIAGIRQINEGIEGLLLIDTDQVCFDKSTDQFFSEITKYINLLQGSIFTVVMGNKNKLKDCFFHNNDYLKRFFPHNYSLNDYKSEQLTEIIIFNLQKSVEVNFETRSLIFSAISIIINKHPQIFKYQAYDISEISDNILRNIYINPRIIWNITDKYNKDIILQSFSDFLSKKELDIKID